MGEIEKSYNIEAALDSISKAIAGEEKPLCIVFINEHLEDKSWGPLEKIPGLAAGAVIGGPVGEMLFGGALLSENAKFKGDLKVLIVTVKQVSFGIFDDTPFMSLDGNLSSEHLLLLQSRCDSESFVRETYDMPGPEVSAPEGVVTINGNKLVKFDKSELFINEIIYQTPSLQEVSEQIRSLVGQLASPYDFAEKLRAGETSAVMLFSGGNTILDSQAEAAMGDHSYTRSLIEILATDEQRDILLQRVAVLSIPLKTVIENQLRAKADTYYRALAWFLFWAVLALLSIAATIGLASEQSVIAIVVAVVTAIVALFSSWVCWVNFRTSAWCRTVMSEL